MCPRLLEHPVYFLTKRASPLSINRDRLLIHCIWAIATTKLPLEFNFLGHTAFFPAPLNILGPIYLDS